MKYLHITGISMYLLISLPFNPANAEPSSAQARATAKVLFEEGKKLLDQKKYLGACEKFEESLRLYPTPSIKYQLSKCYEGLGRTASAWARADEAAADWRKRNDPREDDAKKQAEALLPRLARLVIEVPVEVANTPGLEVKRNGEKIGPGQLKEAIAVDPGEVSVEAWAPKRIPWKAVVMVKEGVIERVIVMPLDKEPEPTQETPFLSDKTKKKQPAAPKKIDPEAMPKDSSLSNLQIGAIVSGAVGIGGLALGTIFGARAYSFWDDALSLCPSKTECEQPALDAEKNARSAAFVSNIGFGVAGAAAVTALSLMISDWKWKKASNQMGLHFIPVAEPGQYGAILHKSF